MISFLTTVFLAFIQSATEFLPVSSSGHLVLSEKFGLSNQSLSTDVALHVGTLLAVLIYFSKDIWRMTIHLFHKGPDQTLARNLIIATIPILAVGALWAEIIARFRSPFIIAGTSIFYGLLLWIVDATVRPKTDLRTMTWKEALCIGCAQILALVPGTSRSGITMTCCRALGFNRTDSARFSMLLSIPTIMAAAGYILWQAAQNHTLSQFAHPSMLTGIALSAVFGLLVIYFLLEWLKRASFAVFAVYRVALGLIVLYYFL